MNRTPEPHALSLLGMIPLDKSNNGVLPDGLVLMRNIERALYELELGMIFDEGPEDKELHKRIVELKLEFHDIVDVVMRDTFRHMLEGKAIEEKEE